MSEPIKVGDLVVVVRWPCCGKALGKIGEVEEFGTFDYGDCRACGKETGMKGQTFVRSGTGTYMWPLSWLRRIPPLAELDETEHRESIEA